jgi:hypothetical protein
MNKLATILYSKYLFVWNGRVQFLIDNSRTSFPQMKDTNEEQLSRGLLGQIDKVKPKTNP